MAGSCIARCSARSSYCNTIPTVMTLSMTFDNPPSAAPNRR
jgi:hypothetical protein